MSGTLRKLARGETNFNIAGRLKLWALVSAVVITVCVLGLFIRKLNLSLEFRGGTSFEVPISTPDPITVPEVEDELEEFDLGEIKIQVTGDGGRGDRLVVRTKRSVDKLDDVQTKLAEMAGHSDKNAVSIQDVGPTWGRQVSNKALRGLIVFLILVSLYITMRFELKMAIAALAALFHDLISTAGIYAIVGFEVSPATVIALLTLMGFSLYDTVVVFDRIGENAPSVTGANTYTSMVNRSINEVMMRSINTSLSSVVPVAGLLFVGVFLFGAVTLKDLALAMFVGTLVSTYSSIFVAAPLLAWLKEREPRYQAKAKTSAPRYRAAAGSAPTTTATTTTTMTAEGRAEPAATSVRTGEAIRVPRTAPKPRKRRRGKRR